jgi:signal transduction histidine kinase
VTSTLGRATTGGPGAEERRAWNHVLGERARIAREVHDILAFTLGNLFIQLDAADALLCEGGDADQSRQLVREARRLAAEGLEETRRAIAALRANPVALPEALATLARSDDRVSHTVSGRPRRLRPDASLALYRTAQEALANARKHAPDAPVTMALSFTGETATLRVSNPVLHGRFSPLAATGGGYGLTGLRERAELLGGTLRVGPDDDDWVVELRVPG